MTQGSAVAWSWRSAAYGVTLALPAVVAALGDPAVGLGLAVGVLPAAAVGLRSTRRERALVIVIGAIAGLSIFLGSVVAPYPVVAVAAVFALCVVVASFSADPERRFAPFILVLGLPLYGAGLSEGSWSTGLVAAALIIVGSLYGWLVSLVWPSGRAAPRAPRSPAPRSAMLLYGVQIGAAGAIGAALGYAFGVDHPGWACTAALLVSRPSRLLLDSRGWGRALSVTAGALVACVVAVVSPPHAVIAVVILLALSAAAGTARSRWYVFPFFSTLLVLSLLLVDDSQTPAHWFLERVVLTLVGVGLALGAAWAVPAIARAMSSRAPSR